MKRLISTGMSFAKFFVIYIINDGNYSYFQFDDIESANEYCDLLTKNNKAWVQGRGVILNNNYRSIATMIQKKEDV